MEIRKATPDDAGLVPQELLDGLSVEKRELMWRKILVKIESGKSTNAIFVATDSAGEVIGFVEGGLPRTLADEFDCELNAIYIEERAQRQGVGVALTSALLESFTERGFKKMIIWVLAGNDAQKFYKRIGGRLLSQTKLITIGGKECVSVGYGYDL